MNRKNKYKALVAFAVALAFVLPSSAVFVNDVLEDKTNVRFDPPSQIVEKGETFTASYYIEPTDWVTGANFVTIAFDLTLLHADSVTEGDTTPPVTICILDPEFPDGDNGWYVSCITVTLVATDEGAGVESTWYRVDGGYWKIYTKPFVVCGEGLHKIEYYSFDRAKPRNKEDVNTAEFKIDTKPSVTTHKFDGMMVEGCFISNVIVTLFAEDKMSGVNYTMYNLNNDTWIVYNDSFVVTEDGGYTLYYYSIDLAGNTEQTNEAGFKIEHDTVPPVTDHAFSGVMGENNWYVSNVAVTLTAVDNLAGVDYTKYKLEDDVEWQDYTGLFPVTEDGEHTIEYYSVDKVGNKEGDKGPFDFKIDQTAPTIVLVAEGSGSTWLLTATVSDETSGIDRVEFYVAGAYVETVTDEPYEWEYTGASSGDIAQAIAYDKAGNLKISNDEAGQSQDQDAFIGWTFLMGWISNMEETENIITAQAIRLRYIEVVPNGISTGFVKMGTVEFSSQFLVRTRTLRSFGRMSMVIGIFKGGIIIEGK